MAEDEYIEQLRASFDRHFSEMARAEAWTVGGVERFGAGARMNFESDNLIVRFVNERRLLYVEVASAANPETGFTASQLKDWLEPSPEGRWNLSLAETARFLSRHWERLDNAFSPDNVDATVLILAELSAR